MTSGMRSPVSAAKNTIRAPRPPSVQNELERGRVVRLQLTPEQAAQLAPLALDAASKRQNVLFISVVVPFWLPDEGAAVWELQATRVPATQVTRSRG